MTDIERRLAALEFFVNDLRERAQQHDLEHMTPGQSGHYLRHLRESGQSEPLGPLKPTDGDAETPIFFTFSIDQLVRITAFGLDYRGRVLRCILTMAGDIYDVEYARDGDIKRYEFARDQLEAECLG